MTSVGCAQPNATPLQAVEERRVSPGEANARITRWIDDHYIWMRTPTRATRIMLLLPGTDRKPAFGRMIGRIAAEQGYRVIGLKYADDMAVVTACASDPDPQCMEQVRQEIVTGGEFSRHVTVDRDNSIDGRLADLLRHLAATYPAEDWSGFLDERGSLRWERIAVGGLSQGGGHAAFIAKIRSVPRVVMFGAPADGYNGQVAPWMQPGVTPVDRYYGFRHARDQFRSIEPNWLALGMGAFGASATVDGANTTFGGSHMLVTDMLPATGTYLHSHGSVFEDAITPLRPDRTPVFDSAWRFLLGRP